MEPSRPRRVSPGRPTESNAESTRDALSAAGSLVKQLRVDAGLSLAGLAGLSDLSPGLLSQIERGMGNPSLSTVIKIAQALGVPAGRFFDGLDDAASVVRANARPRLEVAERGLVYELMTPHLHGQIGVVKTEIPPGFSNEEAPFSHVGEECSIVLEGTILCTIDNVAYELQAGDSVTFNSALKHWYRNDSDEYCRLIGAMTPPSF